MFGETRLSTSYFQQITLRSKILKIINTSLKKWSVMSINLEKSVHYFDQFGGVVFFLKNMVCCVWFHYKLGNVNVIYSSFSIIIIIIIFFFLRLWHRQ